MQKTCLFCGGANPNSLEHIIPESLGNDDLILKDDVCAHCNNYFSKIERYVLQKTEIAYWRTILGIRTKKGKLPSVNLSQPSKPKGTLPDLHWKRDSGIGFTFHDDGSCSIEINDATVIRKIVAGDRTQFNFVMTPKVLHELGRFLCKIGVELLCSVDPTGARADAFKSARNYARYGSTSDLWPIFHYSSGGIRDLRRIVDSDWEK